MIKDLRYKGFSLVEVMILFTLLSVIMAASMTMISKKSSAVPPKVSHGMYRCIYTSDGVIEEEYNSTDRLYPTRSVSGNQCTFRVPKAAMYKIDMYSAGSGGTEYAEINSSVEPNSNDVIYSLDNLTPEYVNAQTGQLFIPTDIEFFEMLNGKYVVGSVFSGDAGSGGGVYVTYPSVADVSCLSPEHQSLKDTDTSDLEAQLEIVRNFKKEDMYPIIYMYNDRSSWPNPTMIRVAVPYGEDSAMVYTPEVPWFYTELRSYDALLVYYQTLDGPEDYNYVSHNAMDHAFDYLGEVLIDTCKPHSSRPDGCASIAGPMFTGDNLMYGSHYFGNQSYVHSAENRVAEVYKDMNWFYDFDDEAVYDEYNNINNNVYSHRLYYEQYHPSNTPICTFSWNFTETIFNPKRAYSCSLRLAPLLDQIMDETKLITMWDLERQIKEAGYTDLMDVPEFAALYNNQSVVNDKVKSQIRDYCKMEFKPIYQSLGIFNNNTKIDEEIQYGKKRVISTLGGNEGLGKLSTKIYKLSSTGRYSILGGGSFMSYASKVKENQLTPVYCDKNMNNCSTEPPNSDCPAFWNFFSQANVGCVKKGTDSNLAGSLNYNSLSTTITQNDVKIAHYSPSNNDDFGPAITNGRYVITEDGKAPEKIPAWKADALTKIPAVSALPEGGKAPKVHIKLNYDAYNRTSACDFTYWTCPKTEEYVANAYIYELADQVQATFSSTLDGVQTNEIPWWAISKYYDVYFKAHVSNNGVIFNKNVADTAMIDSIGTSSNATASEASDSNYKVISSDGVTHDTPVDSLNPSTFPMFQEPYIKAKSWKWKKEYALGGHGNEGKFISLTATDLGTSCTMKVPAPGEVYRRGVDDPFVLNESLSASITCRNNRGQVVFDHTLEGNGYNESILSGSEFVEPNTYTWMPNINEDGGVWEVRLVNNPDRPNWRPTSVLSVLINKYFRLNNGDYDIKSRYGIGAPGSGTRLDDYCLVRKGKYQREMYYKIKYNDSTDNITSRRNSSKTGCNYLLEGDPECELSSTYNYPISYLNERDVKIEGSEKSVSRDGNYKGYNCYGENAGTPGATDGRWILQSDTPAVQSGLFDIHADQGGGGAIVISW